MLCAKYNLQSERTFETPCSFDVKFQSLNVRGLNKSIKRRSIFRWLHNQRFHFAFLQETYSSKECPLCNLESQSLKHMLITCRVSSSFWTCFSDWWHKKFNQKLTLSESTILYGWHKESNNWEVLNYCLIVAKYNVFATSVRNGVLDFDSFLLRLNNKIDILRTIAFRSNRLSQFKKTWAKLL